jgi:DNA (cytosine-5)-methyltransferase 1
MNIAPFIEILELAKSELLQSKSVEINPYLVERLNIIFKKSDTQLGVLNVLFTSLLKNTVDPTQDVRLHQSSMDGGYSGRSLDTKVTVPWLQKEGLKSMRESGWLTRSLEQPHAYNIDYPGKISNVAVKCAFLEVLKFVEENPEESFPSLKYLLSLLYLEKEENKIEISRALDSSKLSINNLYKIIYKLIEESDTSGKARIPVLAIYSVYISLTNELNRFDKMVLSPIGSHTSADMRSGDIGDVCILIKDVPFEAVEVKHGIKISEQMIYRAYEKFKKYPTNRYYILSTVEPSNHDKQSMEEILDKISFEHGCEVIINGLYTTLKYYLRLIKNIDEFINNFTTLILSDSVVKIQDKKRWKDLIELK